MTQGRGAWTERGKQSGSVYYCMKQDEPLDGTEPEVLPGEDWPEDPLGVEEFSDPDWYDRVHRGVLGIQRLLRLNGVPEVPLNGIHEAKTDLAVQRFQTLYPEKVGAADGLVGPRTMKALMHIVLISAGAGASVDPRYLYAQACKETQFDPGAQGQLNAPDSGIFQFNLKAGTDTRITQKELDFAYHPVKSAHASAKRFRAALDQYRGKGWQLRLHCAIAQHNSPLWANQWFENGQPPNDTIDEYVAKTLMYAEEWTA
jgi:hypothetical protein